MASLSDKFPSKEIYLDEEGLKALEQQLRSLRARVKAGDYVVEAKEKVEQGEGHNTIDRELKVVIKRAEHNATSLVETMTFEFSDKGYQGTSFASFDIRTTDGKLFIGNDHGQSWSFLDKARKLGEEKIAQDRRTPKRTAIDVIKNNIRL